MEETNFLTPGEQKPSNPHKSISHWLVVGASIIVILIFLVISYYESLWPFGSFLPKLNPLSPVATLGPAPEYNAVPDFTGSEESTDPSVTPELY